MKQFSLEHIIKECIEYKSLIPDQYKKDPSELDIVDCVNLAILLSETEIFEYL